MTCDTSHALPTSVIIDASTLINFLAAGCANLLTENPRYRFVITEHVRAEVMDHYATQLERLDRLLAEEKLFEEPLTEIDALALYASLTSQKLSAPKALGDGEAASIAAAILRGRPLAIDDKAALRKAVALKADLQTLDTQHLMIEAIRDGRISIDGADQIKAEWEKKHKFRLKFVSFRDVC